MMAAPSVETARIWLRKVNQPGKGPSTQPNLGSVTFRCWALGGGRASDV